ncbi:hypothetical protein I546_0609 [Mycobacterium kansasii 732]|nr:hypothetical protein I546_0609 [Mycobacterium kansasii 732]
MRCIGTFILGRPFRQRRADQPYTLICEEPVFSRWCYRHAHLRFDANP